MGPEKNAELFQAVAEPRLPSLKGEFIRRGLLGESLRQLSDLFESKDNTSHPVTEPTLLLRLYALSQVQRSTMGIAGFEPMLAVNIDEQPNGGVDAKAAPAHDEFMDNNSYYRTRVINITMPDPRYGDMVEVFGLNIYQPTAEEREDAPLEPTEPEILMIGGRGEVQQKKQPITGETVVFAVRNKQTEDAKLYRVAFLDSSETPLKMGPGVEYQSETSASVYLPDGRIATVELIDGELLQQALDELQSASTELNLLLNPDSVLTEEERVAVKDTFGKSSEIDFSLG